MKQRFVPLVLHSVVQDKIESFEDICRSTLADILQSNKRCFSVCDALAGDTNDGGLILTFDDGSKSNIDVVLPLLLECKSNATFFIVVDYIGKKGFMDWADVKALSLEGMEIGSHSMSHPDFRQLDNKSAIEELENSKLEIENKIGVPVKSFSFPFGFAPKQHFVLAKNIGYKYVMGSQHGVICKGYNSILPRNSVHSGVSAKHLAKILSPNLIQELLWKIEDNIKSPLKVMLPLSTYAALRSFLLKIGG